MLYIKNSSNYRIHNQIIAKFMNFNILKKCIYGCRYLVVERKMHYRLVIIQSFNSVFNLVNKMLRAIHFMYIYDHYIFLNNFWS